MMQKIGKTILYAANIRFPSERAHATQIAHMCEAFVSCGADVTLVSNTEMKAVSGAVQTWAGFMPHFSLMNVSAGFKIVPGSPAFFVIRDIVFVFNVVKDIGANHLDYLYIRDEWIGYLLSFFISTKKIIWESHEAKYNFPARRLLKKGVRTVCISKGINDEYLNRGVSKSQLLVADDGIDDTFFEPQLSSSEARLKLKLPKEKFLVGYIGGLDTWKGVETFFLTAGYVHSDIEFVTIGGRNDEVEINQKKYPKIHFLGPRPYAELPSHQQAFDVLVIPNTAKNNLSASYTSPLKLFAHMASGIPVVASDIPSITSITGRELVTLFNPDEPEALAQAIEQVQMNFELKKEQAQKLKLIAAEYTWDKRAKKILNFLGYTI